MTRLYIPEDPIRSLRVLVVEDQMQTRGWIVDMLRVMGIREVLAAADGVDALRLVKEQVRMIDLIICDWAMPRMTGIDLLVAVRQIEPEMPFIMETGHGTRDHVMAARQHGVTAFIVKPFSAAQLEAKVRMVAKGRPPRMIAGSY